MNVVRRHLMIIALALAACEHHAPVATLEIQITGRLLDEARVPLKSGVIYAAARHADGHGSFNATTVGLVTSESQFELRFLLNPPQPLGATLALCYSPDQLDGIVVPPSGFARVAIQPGAMGAISVGDVVMRSVPETLSDGRTPQDLDGLAIKRRAVSMMDPLAIFVHPMSQLVVEFPDQPEITALVLNVDESDEPFHMELRLSNDYHRNKREAFEWCPKWDLEASQDGHAVPPSGRGTPPYDIHTSNLDPLPGQGEARFLSVGAYLQPLHPGRSQVTLTFRKLGAVAERGRNDQRIDYRSHAFDFESRPRHVTLTDAERTRYRQLLREVNLVGPVPIAETALGCSHAEASAASSPETQLLDGGGKTLAVVLEDIDNPAHSTDERRWRLALLYDITGLYDPTECVGLVASIQGGGTYRKLAGRTQSVEPNPTAIAELIKAWSALKWVVVVQKT